MAAAAAAPPAPTLAPPVHLAPNTQNNAVIAPGQHLSTTTVGNSTNIR